MNMYRIVIVRRRRGERFGASFLARRCVIDLG